MSRMGRQSYFVCDLGMRGRGKLRQSRLSFRKTTLPVDNPGVEDDTLGENNLGGKLLLKLSWT